jgi:hypothetical protein
MIRNLKREKKEYSLRKTEQLVKWTRRLKERSNSAQAELV